MRIKSVLIYTGYVFAFFVSLYLFVIFSLPEDQIVSFVNEKYIRPAGINLSYKSSSISYKLNLICKEVEIEVVDINQKFALDKLEVGVSVIGLIFGKRPFIARVDGFGGSLETALGIKGDKTFISLNLSEIDASKLDILKEKTGLNIKGLLNLKGDITYDKKESKNNNGKITIEFKGTEIKGGKILGFEIPVINIGEIKGEVEIKEGKFKINSFKSKGKDVEIRLSGDGSLQSPPSRSSLNLSLRAKPSQSLVDREERLKTVLFGIGSALDKEGFYNFSIKGTLSNPSFNIERK